MRQLRGIDGSFLHMETPALPMHTLKVLVFAGPAPTRDEAFAHAGEWLSRLPLFRQRVVELPLGLGQPLLAADASVELARHVRLVRLAAPGTDDALDDLVGAIAREMLPRDRPLWEVVVVDGLAKERWAAVVKVHHTLADGAAALAVLASTFDRPATVEQTEATPPYMSRLVLGLRSLQRSLLAVPTLAARTAQAVRAVRLRRRRGGTAPSGVFEAPRLLLNRTISGARSFARRTLPLARFSAIRSKTGATLNDVVLAVVAGAMRSYLLGRGELPDQPLVASVPVGGGHEHAVGNDITSLFAALPCQSSEPLERLSAIQASMRAAKEELSLVAPLERAWLEALPPFVFERVMRVPVSLFSRRGPPINLVVSSVRGPAEPLSVNGRELLAISSVGPLVANVGLNVTAWSYSGQVFFGLLACQEATPDLSTLADALTTSLAELEAATAGADASRDA